MGTCASFCLCCCVECLSVLYVLPANLEDLPMLSLPLLRSMQFLDSMRGQRGIMLPEGLLHRGKHCRVTEGSITITFPIDLMPAWQQVAQLTNRIPMCSCASSIFRQ